MTWSLAFIRLVVCLFIFLVLIGSLFYELVFELLLILVVSY